MFVYFFPYLQDIEFPVEDSGLITSKYQFSWKSSKANLPEMLGSLVSRAPPTMAVFNLGSCNVFCGSSSLEVSVSPQLGAPYFFVSLYLFKDIFWDVFGSRCSMDQQLRATAIGHKESPRKSLVGSESELQQTKSPTKTLASRPKPMNNHWKPQKKTLKLLPLKKTHCLHCHHVKIT